MEKKKEQTWFCSCSVATVHVHGCAHLCKTVIFRCAETVKLFNFVFFFLSCWSPAVSISIFFISTSKKIFWHCMIRSMWRKCCWYSPVNRINKKFSAYLNGQRARRYPILKIKNAETSWDALSLSLSPFHSRGLSVMLRLNDYGLNCKMSYCKIKFPKQGRRYQFYVLFKPYKLGTAQPVYLSDSMHMT